MPEKPMTLISDGALLEMVCLALTTPLGPIVEVGVYQGGSAWYLARVAAHRGCEHCDVDQCESIRQVIECLWPRVVLGGLMVFGRFVRKSYDKLSNHPSV
jgi:hypothetical protein